jgi:diaminopimelate epimerase
MCGNGLRASALFISLQEKITPGQEFILSSDGGRHRVRMESVHEATVELKATTRQDAPKPELLYLPDKFSVLGFEHTGVPHLIIETKEELETRHIREWGRRLRYDPLFLPEGTNVDFVRRIAENEILVRTYERGVEDETYSCGTGAVACAVAYWKKNRIAANVIHIRTRGGQLKVSRQTDRNFLTGPVYQVFTGQIEI